MKEQAVCSRCHRPIKDPASIKAGMGRVCRKKNAEEGEEQIKLELDNMGENKERECSYE